MTDADIDQLGDSVSQTYRLDVPVNLARIAEEEGIELVDGDFGPDFHGRIEYLVDERIFAIYHPAASTEVFPGRVRFTIAHEFGHYFIPEHREMMLKELVHDSSENFRSSSRIEQEANRFAAALLIPSSFLKGKLGRRGFLALKEIRGIASECETSLQATAFRYSQFALEPHLAILSENGRILFHFASEEAKALGFAGLGNRKVPDGSPAALALHDESRDIHEDATNTETWFSERFQRADLWEESVNLGYGGRVLTLLSWQNYIVR